MKPAKRTILSLLAGLFLLVGARLAAEESIYGHISFVDNGATVLRADGSENQAVVNLPVVPGDTVVTTAGGRCELQFDNGTVVRLDKNSRLRVDHGAGSEPDLALEDHHPGAGEGAAVHPAPDLRLGDVPDRHAERRREPEEPDDGHHPLGCRRRHVVLFRWRQIRGAVRADNRSLKKATVKADRPLAITAANALAERVEKRDIEFMAWNEYVDRHFKDLHYGISKVPPKLQVRQHGIDLLGGEVVVALRRMDL